MGRSSRNAPQQPGRGQAVPAVALVLWAVAGASLVVALVGERAVDRSRAQAGADAVALAGAGGGDPWPVAARNQVRIERLEEGVEVDVVVSSGSAQAAARARSGREDWRGLDPRLQRALGAAEVALGYRIPIVSGWRSRADQERLWANRHANPYPVAPPGTSLHERGLAVDVPLGLTSSLAQVGSGVGLCQPLPVTDPVHFVLC